MFFAHDLEYLGGSISMSRRINTWPDGGSIGTEAKSASDKGDHVFRTSNLPLHQQHKNDMQSIRIAVVNDRKLSVVSIGFENNSNIKTVRKYSLTVEMRRTAQG